MKLPLIVAIAVFGGLVVMMSKPGQAVQSPSLINQLLDKIPRPEQLTSELNGSLREPIKAVPRTAMLPLQSFAPSLPVAPHREAAPTDPAEPTQADVDRGYQAVVTHDAGMRIVEALPIVQGPDGPRAAPEQPHFRVIGEDVADQPAPRKLLPQEIACAQQAATGRFLPLECPQ